LTIYWELIVKFWKFEKVILQNLANLGQIFHEKSFVCKSKSYFQVQIWQNFTKETNAEVNTHFGMVKSLPIALGKAPGEPIRAS